MKRVTSRNIHITYIGKFKDGSKLTKRRTKIELHEKPQQQIVM